MALYHVYNQDGIYGNYWKCCGVFIDVHNNCSTTCMKLWENKDTRDDGDDHIHALQFHWKGSDFWLTNTAMDTSDDSAIAMVYDKIKATIWTDATDI